MDFCAPASSNCPTRPSLQVPGCVLVSHWPRWSFSYSSPTLCRSLPSSHPLESPIWTWTSLQTLASLLNQGLTRYVLCSGPRPRIASRSTSSRSCVAFLTTSFPFLHLASYDILPSTQAFFKPSATSLQRSLMSGQIESLC